MGSGGFLSISGDVEVGEGRTGGGLVALVSNARGHLKERSRRVDSSSWGRGIAWGLDVDWEKRETHAAGAKGSRMYCYGIIQVF